MEKKGPEEVPEEERCADPTSQPAAVDRAQRWLAASAIAFDLAAQLLGVVGRDGLAVAAKAIAHLLHLIAMFTRHNDQR
jgi:hypothetical protein